MIVRLVAVALRVYVAHLNEFGIGIAIKLPCRPALSDELGHPGGQGGACLYGHTNPTIAIEGQIVTESERAGAFSSEKIPLLGECRNSSGRLFLG